MTRLKGFDGLRAIAALSIVVLHTTSATGASVTGTFARYFARFDAGVAIFFVISAFLLYRPFLRAHLDAAPKVAVGNFYWRRAVRIYPAYWVALTVVIVIFGNAHISGIGQYFLHYGLIQIYTPKLLAGIIPAWTLAVEVSFYALLPLYAWLLGRLTASRSLATRVNIELGAAVIVMMSSLAARTVVGAVSGTDTYRLKWLPFMADWFAFGFVLAIGAVAVERGIASARLSREVGFADRHPGIVALIGLAAFLVAAHIGLPLTFTAGTVLQDVTRQFAYGVMAFSFVAIAAWRTTSGGAIRGFLDSRVMIALGTISYGVFLWHYDLLHQLLRWNFTEHVRTLTTPALLFVVFVAAIVFATASWFLVEKPLLRWARDPKKVPTDRSAA
ncbi:MAG TPA: acyltransferase [Acidimicrobiia bacterium]|nr:acyltransferase [Acidimicrobiia bacterium]